MNDIFIYIYIYIYMYIRDIYVRDSLDDSLDDFG